MSIELIETPEVGNKQQFLAWHNEVPYLADFVPHGAGFYHRFTFKVADPDFKNTLADEKRELFADPEDVNQAGTPAAYLESVLAV